MTPLQKGLFFQAQLAGSAGHYVAQNYFTFDRRLDTDALAEAMAYVIARHPVVGAGFTTDDDGIPGPGPRGGPAGRCPHGRAGDGRGGRGAARPGPRHRASTRVSRR